MRLNYQRLTPAQRLDLAQKLRYAPGAAHHWVTLIHWNNRVLMISFCVRCSITSISYPIALPKTKTSVMLATRTPMNPGGTLPISWAIQLLFL
jgi:hypothetical protein